MLLLTFQRLRSNEATDVRESEKGRHHLIRRAVVIEIGPNEICTCSFISSVGIVSYYDARVTPFYFLYQEIITT